MFERAWKTGNGARRALPRGLEPRLTVPETVALSIELRERKKKVKAGQGSQTRQAYRKFQEKNLKTIRVVLQAQKKRPFYFFSFMSRQNM